MPSFRRSYDGDRTSSPGNPDEGGFSLIEATIALGLLALVLSLLLHNLVSASASIVMSRQRVAATALANGVLEEVRAMNFDDLRMPASVSDNLIVDGAAGKEFRGRVIPTTGAAVEPPFQPHRVSVTPTNSSTTYRRAVYVTWENASDFRSKIVTVRVDWPSTAAGGAEPVVELQTLVTEYQCEQSAGSSRPCEPFWSAKATADPATVEVAGTLAGTPVETTMRLSGRSTQLQTEQLSSVRSQITSPTLQFQDSTLPADAAELEAVADDDVATAPTPLSDRPATAQGSLQPASVRGESGSSWATLQASVPSINASGADVLADVRAFPFIGRATSVRDAPGTGSDPSTVTYSYRGPDGTGSNDVRLVSIAPAGPSASRESEVERLDASVESTTSKSFGEVRVGELGATGPSGWNGYLLRLTNWSTGTSTTPVKAAAGPGLTASALPTVAQQGTLSYWNGTGYSSIDLTSAASPLARTPLDVSVTSGACTHRIVGDFTTGGVVRTPTVLPASGLVNAATAEVRTPLDARLQYSITCSGQSVPLVDLSVAVDLGGVKAESQYAAPRSTP